MLKVAVVICTYNRYDLLPKAIDGALAQDFPEDEYEIIIVDNTPNAANEKGKELKEQYSNAKNVKYLFEETPGLSNARNVAMNATEAKYISYIDDDAIPHQAWLKNVVAGFESFDNVGVVGGKITPMWETERPAWLSDQLTGHVSVVDWGGKMRVAAESEWFAGANISFLREALIASGGFSTNLGRIGNGNSLMSNEEIEVLEYIKKENFAAVYSPEAEVDHLVEKKRLTRDWFRRRVAWQATSDFIMKPEEAEAKVQSAIGSVKDYLASLPPLERNIQGLYFKAETSGEFIWQLSAIYNYTIMTLAGFEGLEDE
jgi:glycosyltransferase involved in cell wall biosynthesis